MTEAKTTCDHEVVITIDRTEDYPGQYISILMKKSIELPSYRLLYLDENEEAHTCLLRKEGDAFKIITAQYLLEKAGMVQ